MRSRTPPHLTDWNGTIFRSLWAATNEPSRRERESNPGGFPASARWDTFLDRGSVLSNVDVSVPDFPQAAHFSYDGKSPAIRTDENILYLAYFIPRWPVTWLSSSRSTLMPLG
jgi:hypothetical protein